MKIEDLDWSVRTYHCIKFYGIDTVEQLAEMTDDDLMKIRNINKKVFMEIKQKLSEVQIANTNSDIKCWLCSDLKSIYKTECHIPMYSGDAVGILMEYCPNCGKKIEW